MRKAALHNLGCKVNAYETEAMQELLEKEGYQIVPFYEEADVYIINTCSVTNMADRKSRQMIHKARKQNPHAIIVATGCYVQAQEENGVQDENIDIIIGNNRKNDIINILNDYLHTDQDEQFKDAIDINHTYEFEEMHLTRTGEHTRAYLKVQDGCNQFCSYCIIPYVRGRVRSRKKQDVVNEVTDLVANGYKEVVLTGIHLSSYGVDFEEDENLLTLIKAVHQIEGVERIRLGSLEPRIITDEFAEELSKMPKICPHFHLSMQSGSDATLKRMNRRYDSKEYYEKCCILRKYFELPALTTDVIVGFPGETEEEFEESKNFIDKVDFYETHIFKYSRRKGTRADKMECQIPESVKTQRSAQLQELNEQKMRKYESKWIGREVEVLFEEIVERNGISMAVGHTKEYMKIGVPCGDDNEAEWVNKIKRIKIVDSSQIIN